MWAKRTRDKLTNPSARIRQGIPPPGPAVLWPNEPERPPTSDWAKMANWAERTQRQAAARTKPVPSPSRLNPPTRLSVENSPVFFLLFTGKPIFALAAVVPVLSLREDQSVARAPIGKNPRREAHATAGLFWPNEPKETARSAFGQTIPRGSPVTPVAKQSQGAPSHDFGQTNPSCGPVPRLRQTNPTSNRAARVSAK
jgi:hypothetical protein